MMIVRPAAESDIPAMLALIRELAEHENQEQLPPVNPSDGWVGG
jgi:hypothetical protein